MDIIRLAGLMLDTREREIGFKMKQMRQRLGMSVRDVVKSSAGIAGKFHDHRYAITASRLSNIENFGDVPGVFKLFSLSVIYQIPLYTILGIFGLDVQKREDYSPYIKNDTTHPVDFFPPGESINTPVLFSTGVSTRDTQLLNLIVKEWRDVPVEFFRMMDFSRFLYVLIGQTDDFMHPLLRSGSIVKVDTARNQIEQKNWRNEYERPIYLVATHTGYRCAFCLQRDRELILMPHPLSQQAPLTYQAELEATVLGQVAGGWMSLA